MVRRQRQENLVNQDNMLEVVYHSLSIQKVHGRSEPIPVEALCRSQLSRLAWDAGDGNDFAKGDDLDGGDDGDDVDVAHEEGGEEAGHHDEGPKGPRQEVGLFLVVLGFLFGRRGLGRGLLLFHLEVS